MLLVDKLQFLSDEWIDAAKALAEEYRDSFDAPEVQTKINVNINEIHHREDPTLQGHLDTSTGTPHVELGHLDDAELTISVDYETAKIILITPDPQQMMAAFMGGKILVEGDVTKLMSLQTNAMNPPPEALELYQKIDALTIKE